MTRFEIPDGWTAQAYRFALDPTPDQIGMLESHAGGARFAYNTMLAVVCANLDQRQAERSYGIADADLTPGVSWSFQALRNEWNRRKDVVAVGKDGSAWWPQNSKEVYANACRALSVALSNWDTSRRGARRGPRIGFPCHKSKGSAPKKFSFTTGAIHVDPGRHHVVLPRIGRIRTHESTRKLARRLQNGTARILSVTVRFISNRWQCAFQVIVEGKARPSHARRSPHRAVGIDVGVKDLLVIAAADGTEVDRVPAPKPLTRMGSRLRAVQRNAARRSGPYDPETHSYRQPSNRWLRATARVGRIHAKVAAIRAHEILRVTTELAARHTVVTVEQLSVKNMGRSGGRRKRGLNRALGDAAIGRIRTQLGYKTTWYGSTLVTAPRFFASTQLCSRCRGENQTPAARSRLSLPQRVPGN